MLESEWKVIALEFLRNHPKVALIEVMDSDRVRNRKYRKGRAGHPDIVGFTVDGKALYIELKRPKGGSRSLEQIEFIRRARAFGVRAGFARTIEEIEAILAQ